MAATARSRAPGLDHGPLVGREEELGRLRSAVTAVAGGEPTAVLLGGPPGIGKTRLAAETLAEAEAAGFAAFRGQARELARDVAYAPVAEAFGAALRSMSRVRRDALVGDLPQLGLVCGGLGLVPPPPLGDPALERTRLMEGFARLVERLARDHPLALFLDDVHAADPGTVALIAYLAASLGDQPVLLLLTARPDEPGHDQLARLVAGLAQSTWGLTQLTLQPLPDPVAASLVAGLLGQQVDAQLAARVVDRCAGRPFFLHAVARALTESGRLTEVGGALRLSGTDLPLPDDVRTLLRARVTALTPPESAVLQLLAVAGGDLEHDVLASSTGLPSPQLLDALDALQGRGLLAATASAGFELAHGLLRDTVLADLSPVATSRLHARLVETLTATHPGDPRVPEHVLGAGPLVPANQALGHLRAGGERALRLGAGEDAERYLSAAVPLARHQADSAVLGALLTELGRVRQRVGRPGDARSLWEEAAQTYARNGDAVRLADVERELGLLAWSQGSLDDARSRFASAERALEGLAPSPEHAELLFATMVTASRVGDVEVVEASTRRLHELAADLGSPSLSARTHLADAVLAYAATDYVAMAEHSARGLAAAEAGDELSLMMRAQDQLSVAAASQGDLPGLRRHSEASLALVARIGAPSLAGWPRIRLAYADLLAGDWDAALRTTAEVVTLASRFTEQRGLVSTSATHALMLVHLGRLDEARGYVEKARQAAHPMLEADRNVFSMVAMAAARLALAQDDPEAALPFSPQLSDLSGGWFPLFAAATLGEAQARSGRLGDARDTSARIRGVRGCGTCLAEGLGDWLDGLAAAHETRAGPAAASLRGAAACFDRLGLPFHAARARLELSRTLLAAEPAAAAEEAGAAFRTFDSLGAAVEAQQARTLLRGLGKVPSRGRARGRADAPLSPRELEVGRLVAAGLSNAAVATQLFVSPRTVTTHLDRIYARLGLTSRVALTRYLADSGLLDGPDAPAAAPRGGAAPGT